MKNYRLFLAFLLLLLSVDAASAQQLNYPAESTANIFTSSNQFLVGIQLGPLPFANLPPSPAAGSELWCLDCTENTNPCIGSGSGAFAFSFGGSWACSSESGGGGTVNLGTAGCVGYYATSTAVISGQCGLTFLGGNGTFSGNLSIALALNVVTGPFTLGLFPPGVCGTASSCWGFSTSTGAVSPATGQYSMRWFSNAFQCSISGAAEAPCLGNGTVTSVGLSVPSWLSVANSPITSAGTIAVSAATGETSGQVIGTCGVATSFGPCALVRGDLSGITFVAGTNGFGTAAFTAASTAASITTLIQGLSGCNTATYLYSPQASDCVAPGAGTPYPSGTGIPEVTSGTSWGATYNASNPIPANFLATSGISNVVYNNTNNIVTSGMGLNMSSSTLTNSFQLPGGSLSTGGALNWNSSNGNYDGYIGGAANALLFGTGLTANCIPEYGASAPLVLTTSSSICLNTSGFPISLGNLTLVNGGWAGEIYKTDSGTQTGSFGPTTMVATTPAATTWYRISFYTEQVAVGTSCTGNTQIEAQVGFNNPNETGSPNMPVGTAEIIANGTANRQVQCGGGQLGQGCGTAVFPAKASTAVTYSITYTAGSGCSPGPTYHITPILEQL